MSINKRKMMDNALKKILVPVLRKLEFKGSFPHFRRLNENNIDLITFQFNRWGGSFIVELATCSTDGVTMYFGEQVPPNKVTAHCINKRFRLGAQSEEVDGIWFDFENAKTEEDFEKVAFRVLALLNVTDRLWISNLFS
ncbi:DUF4304 domain-containing protein [Psychrobacillus sp. NPDC093180]|uniref:DUF4304 domain-containing protein n=1 Tax=Psychrobacillus sp. NPDC093180 TaxID=3364489 RepID=UPI0038080928